MDEASKLKTWKKIWIIGFPVLVAGMEIFLKFSWAKADYFEGFGISLCTASIGQILPFLLFESILVSKLFAIAHKPGAEAYVIEYRPSFDQASNLEQVRYWALALGAVVSILFIVSIFFACKSGMLAYSYLSGVIAAVLSTSFLVKI